MWIRVIAGRSLPVVSLLACLLAGSSVGRAQSGVSDWMVDIQDRIPGLYLETTGQVTYTLSWSGKREDIQEAVVGFAGGRPFSRFMPRLRLQRSSMSEPRQPGPADLSMPTVSFDARATALHGGGACLSGWIDGVLHTFVLTADGSLELSVGEQTSALVRLAGQPDPRDVEGLVWFSGRAKDSFEKAAKLGRVHEFAALFRATVTMRSEMDLEWQRYQAEDTAWRLGELGLGPLGMFLPKIREQTGTGEEPRGIGTEVGTNQGGPPLRDPGVIPSGPPGVVDLVIAVGAAALMPIVFSFQDFEVGLLVANDTDEEVTLVRDDVPWGYRKDGPAAITLPARLDDGTIYAVPYLFAARFGLSGTLGTITFKGSELYYVIGFGAPYRDSVAIRHRNRCGVAISTWLSNTVPGKVEYTNKTSGNGWVGPLGLKVTPVKHEERDKNLFDVEIDTNLREARIADSDRREQAGHVYSLHAAMADPEAKGVQMVVLIQKNPH